MSFNVVLYFVKHENRFFKRVGSEQNMREEKNSLGLGAFGV